jgi:glycosyltransferase involved in cell wall biosynthesis
VGWWQPGVALRAPRVVVPSEYMRNVVALWGIDQKKIVRIYSALNPINIADAKEDLRHRFGYSGFVIVTAARLVSWKGIEVLINTVEKLHTQGIEVTLEVIGDGIQKEYLMQHIQKKNAESYIHLQGKLLAPELAERAKASDVFVLNTAYEGLSHQLLEVMDIGTPIITTKVGGNAELVTDAKEGLIVAFNNQEEMLHALLRIKNDPVLCTQLVYAAREKSKLFHEDVIIPEVIKLFS